MLNYLSKVFYIIPSRKTRLIWIFLLFLFLSCLEVFGLGLIAPFLSLATEPDLIETNTISQQLYQYFSFQSKGLFVATIGFIIIGVFIVKSVLAWRIRVYILQFGFWVRGELCRKLISQYLAAPYYFHLTRNSAELIQQITEYTRFFAIDIVIELLNTSSSLMIAVAITILLCFNSLVTVLAILLICLPLVILLVFVRKKIRYWGKKATRSNEQMVRVINHSLGGIKESKVIGCSNYFEQQISEEADIYERASSWVFSVILLPRLIMETVLVILLIGATSVVLIIYQDITDLIAVLGVFALASLRLVPSLTQVTSGLYKLRSQSYTLERLYGDLKQLETLNTVSEQNPIVLSSARSFGRNLTNSSPPVLSFQKSIVLDQVAYAYPNSAGLALDKVSLSIERGESIALIGKSGAGKTTLVDVILGLLIPSSGDIQVDGQSIYKNLRDWQNLIGYIPQSIFLMDDTIEKNIAFGVREEEIDSERLKRAIHSAQLDELMADLPDGVKTMVGERGVRLSGGQRQRIGIARALYHERDILVLDEATAALDNETEGLVTESIRSLSGSKTMIIIAHRLTTVEHCDRVYMMDKGRILKVGSYQEIVVEGDLL
ncbi:ABC transporter ATP-binding protein/permease [Spirulina subsalsa FACHB-351]|uniref:ABC transporter ATP-binding protein/permease n=1 Tax=Spirulina subsalsa FACHB-351 TaxID=234711 RepID=A0ABT3L719_9CYAN|nr:ABC transporter ATP-binding protein [Spirulina subsalsa]MCW6037312.1 ABC transporter ATP-binding protein/permease [Spirulina subsalsa FACHB-351]